LNRIVKGSLIAFTSILVVLSLLSSPSVASPNDEKPIIVCTTTILSSFVEQIGGNYVTVEAIVPPGICPAHYDVTPSAVHAVSTASLVLYAGFEPWLESLVNASLRKRERNPTAGRWALAPLHGRTEVRKEDKGRLERGDAGARQLL